MQNVILICPSHKFGGSVQPRIELPLSLLTIATPLDRAGYRVVIIDQRIEKSWRQRLLEELDYDPICVGITSMTGPQISHGLDAAAVVRRHSKAPIIWGGIHPTLMPRQTVAHELVDIVVEGEGEETFFELVQALESRSPLNGVKGIWYKTEHGICNTNPRPMIDLNLQPPLSYHLVDLQKYLVNVFGKGHLSFETSRGCPFKCNYCYNTRVYDSTWRSLSIDETIRRIKILTSSHGITNFLFSDDNFFGSKKRAIQLLERIRDENLGVCISKIDAHISVLSKLSDRELTLLKESGVRMLMIGVESGSPRMLNFIRKELNIDSIIEFNRRIAAFDIIPLYFFMVGYPTESYQEIAQTIALYIKLTNENPQAAAHVNIYTPFPGTGLFDVAVQEGLKQPQTLEQWVPFNYRTVNDAAPWLSREMRQLIRMLHFTTMLAGKSNFTNPYKKTNPIAVWLARLYYPLARLRVKKLFYRFPIEVKMAETLGLYPKQNQSRS